jgi:hypothetical protein
VTSGTLQTRAGIQRSSHLLEVEEAVTAIARVQAAGSAITAVGCVEGRSFAETL